MNNKKYVLFYGSINIMLTYIICYVNIILVIWRYFPYLCHRWRIVVDSPNRILINESGLYSLIFQGADPSQVFELIKDFNKYLEEYNNNVA